MDLAPLQLVRYWIDDISIHSNRNFEPESEEGEFLKSLEVESDVHKIDPPDETTAEHGQFWLVSVSVTVGDDEKNMDPYDIMLNLSGVVQSHPKFDDATAERAISVNGPSMLFGIAREVIRTTTAGGPYATVLLPSVSFLKQAETEAE